MLVLHAVQWGQTNAINRGWKSNPVNTVKSIPSVYYAGKVVTLEDKWRVFYWGWQMVGGATNLNDGLMEM